MPLGKSKSGVPYGKNGPLGRAVLIILIDILIAAWISYVLFNSVLGMISFVPVFIIHLRLYRKSESEKALTSFYEHYREFLSGLSGGLRAGHSLENAFGDGENALVVLYGKKDFLVKEVHAMKRRIGMNIPVEEVFSGFAKEHPLEEVENMAEILAVGKRLGGDYIRSISEACEKIRQSLELKAKIETLTSEKRLELKLMLIMPPGIFTYIRFMSPEFLQPMYHTALGIAAVFGCFVLYAAAIWTGKKITKIEV